MRLLILIPTLLVMKLFWCITMVRMVIALSLVAVETKIRNPPQHTEEKCTKHTIMAETIQENFHLAVLDELMRLILTTTLFMN